MSHSCITVLCGFLIVVLLITIVSCTCTDGFRSKVQKIKLSERVVKKGKPSHSTFKNMGLDGVEYYDAKQLWKQNKYDVQNVSRIL